MIARVLPGLLAALLLAGSASAQGRRDTSDLGESERTLQQKQRQLNEERAKVAQARKREASILAELEDTDKRIAEKRRQVAKPLKPVHLEAVEEALHRRFGAQVAIKPGRKRGKIEITYQGEEDLQRLLSLLNG